jgi:uncharacterized membrane protein YbjE (DUF340 family)
MVVVVVVVVVVGHLSHDLIHTTIAVKQLMLLLLLCKVGFVANDSATALKLIEKGFKVCPVFVACLWG